MTVALYYEYRNLDHTNTIERNHGYRWIYEDFLSGQTVEQILVDHTQFERLHKICWHIRTTNWHRISYTGINRSLPDAYALCCAIAMHDYGVGYG